MRTSMLSAGLACFVAAYGSSISSNAMAATAIGLNFSGGAVCQLSIPTTNTGVRPKATGFRNESTTTSNFVICPLQSSPQDSNDIFTDALLAMYSLDGVSHNVSCTAVSGFLQTGYVYSTKNVTVTSTSSYAFAEWTAVDFGGAAGTPITNSLGFSMTCNLPPQVAVDVVQGRFNYNIGA